MIRLYVFILFVLPLSVSCEKDLLRNEHLESGLNILSIPAHPWVLTDATSSGMTNISVDVSFLCLPDTPPYPGLQMALL